jgi:hypothetical protein
MPTLKQRGKTMSKSFKPEVQTGGGSTWSGNALRFATRQEAETYVADLFSRWTMVSNTRVIESDDAVTHQWIDGKGLKAADSESEPHMPARRVSL